MQRSLAGHDADYALWYIYTFSDTYLYPKLYI